MPVDLKEIALLVRLYVEVKDNTTLMPKHLEGMDKDRRKYIEKTLRAIERATKGEELKSYVPSVILSKRGELGLFGSLPDDHVRWICEAADDHIEGRLSIARNHPGGEVLFEPYTRYAVLVLRQMFGSRLVRLDEHSYEMSKVFEGVTDKEFYDFLYALRPPDLENDGMKNEYRKALPFLG
ncbi:MAG: hypothetical protein ABIA12_01315 [Candidatus Aenigmatarchaeota archaeon]